MNSISVNVYRTVKVEESKVIVYSILTGVEYSVATEDEQLAIEHISSLEQQE